MNCTSRMSTYADADTSAVIPGDAPIPGTGGLIALALGVAGIRGRRQRIA